MKSKNEQKEEAKFKKRWQRKSIDYEAIKIKYDKLEELRLVYSKKFKSQKVDISKLSDTNKQI